MSISHGGFENIVTVTEPEEFGVDRYAMLSELITLQKEVRELKRALDIFINKK